MITICSINACLLLWGEGESCWWNVPVRITFSDESDAQLEDSGRAVGAFRLIRRVPVGWLLAHTTHCLYQSPRTIGSLTELWGKKMMQLCRSGSFRFVDRSCGVVLGCCDCHPLKVCECLWELDRWRAEPLHIISAAPDCCPCSVAYSSICSDQWMQ